MRLKIGLKTDRIPNINKNRMLSFLKTCINEADSSYFNKMYCKNSEYDAEEDRDNQPHFRPFVFGVALPKEKTLMEGEIIIDDNVKIIDNIFYLPEESELLLYVSSLDKELIQIIHTGVIKLIKEQFVFPFNEDILLYPSSAKLYQTITVEKNIFNFRTVSPILLNDSVSIQEQNIRLDNIDLVNQKLNEISDVILINTRKYFNLNGAGLYKSLVLTPLENNKDVFVKHTLRAIREKTGKPYIVLVGLYGIFSLSGDPRDLSILANIGIGRKRGQGFGYVEFERKTF